MAAAAELILMEEIIMNILVRLPVKSLVRFKCVSKSWRSLISDTYFIRMHVNHVRNINTNTEFASQIFVRHDYDVGTTFHRMDIYKKEEEEECDHQDGTTVSTPVAISDKELDFPEEFRCDRGNSIEIRGFCDGLVCLVDSGGLLIWNPSIKECRRLPFPHPTTNDYLDDSGPRSLCVLDVYGIGYDPSVDDYKVLKAPIFSSIGEETYSHSSSVNVLALNSNSWKTIQDNFSYYIEYFPFATFTNGRIHWLASCDKNWVAWIIVYFDVVGEKFGEVALPHNEGRDMGNWSTTRLMLLGEKLCIDWFDCSGGKFELWIMMEYHVRDSWTKLLTIPLSEGLGPDNAYCFSSTYIFCSTKDEIVMYNSSDETLSRFFGGSLPRCTLGHITMYQESLVSVSPIRGYGFENVT